MKKLLIILLTFISLSSYAQIQIKENSFRQIDGFVMLDKSEHYDDNDQPMALIKISTENITAEERRRITFKGNLATYFDVHFEPTEIYLYLSTSATFIEIHHPDYGKTEYWLPQDLKGFCGYEMVLRYVPVGIENEVIKPRNTYLIITSDQDNAVIYIDDKFVGTKEVSESFDLGTSHTWKIECNMYHTESGTVTLNDKTIIYKNLRPNFGYINVTSSPENGAKVFVNGEYIGETPCKTDRLKSGSHSVRVMKEMYNSNEKTIVVNDGQTTNANIEMSVNFAILTINTDEGSDIYVDEELKGKGSWTGRLSEGSHYLEARKPSHKTIAKNINLIIGKNETITLEAPKPICGFLDISTTPIMADIYIDGKHYGQTPSVINDLLIGEHELKLEKDGYSFFVKNITIENSKTLELNETLEIGKEVKIITDISGDSIYVDGFYAGISPIEMRVSYGSHDLKAIRNTDVLKQTISITDTSESIRLMFNEINGHEYVDLGLPSGLKWATCNIGADKPEDQGNYYAWGETETKTKYGYDSNYKINNRKDINGTQYDAARVNWGNIWRIPTEDEFQELVDKCVWEWISKNGKKGYKVTGPNSNNIFLPAAGYRYSTEVMSDGYNGKYWSATSNGEKYSYISNSKSYLSFDSYSHDISEYGNGDNGYSIRPVCYFEECIDSEISDNKKNLTNEKFPPQQEKDKHMFSDDEYKTIKYRNHSISILGGAAMGVHFNYNTLGYGSDGTYNVGDISVAKAIGLEYGLLEDDDFGMFVNMMYYFSENRRPALSFIVGKSSLGLRYGAGFCYAEYYTPVSIYNSMENASIKDGFSLGFLFGGNHSLNKNGMITYDFGLFILGNHCFFDLRLGIGLKWDRK